MGDLETALIVQAQLIAGLRHQVAVQMEEINKLRKELNEAREANKE